MQLNLKSMKNQLKIFNCKGTTLIEILVTVIVISIGLLGIIGMQATGLRNNTSAYNRSQATMLAYDIADRARANPLGAAHYDFTAHTPAANSACNTTGGCLPSVMAGNDGHEWLQSLTQGLPDGQGVVCIDSTPNDGTPSAMACDGSGTVYAIKVWWDEDRSGTYKMFVTDFRI